MILVVFVFVVAILLAIGGRELNPIAPEDKRMLALRIFGALLIVGIVAALAGCASVKDAFDAARDGLVR